jgi:lysophospholipase L1-like esterase
MKPFARLILLLVLLNTVQMTPVLNGAEDGFPLNAKRILFLGDSITHAGEFVSMIEMQLRLRGTDPMPELINAGLPSENCTGLSEPDHPFPRPNVHERLDRALAEVKPDVVVACYGMNDGIYYPFSEERFQEYQAGIGLLIEKVKASGARLVLLTPPPFDAMPLKAAGKLLPAGSDKYAWFAVYENYDQVIQKYSQWLLDQSKRVDMVVDLYTPIAAFWVEQRKTDPTFTVAPDGVHCNSQGHRTIAEVVLKSWGVETWIPISEPMTVLINQKSSVLHNSWLSRIGHKRPGMENGLPIAEAVRKAQEIDSQLQPLIDAARKAVR